MSQNDILMFLKGVTFHDSRFFQQFGPGMLKNPGTTQCRFHSKSLKSAPFEDSSVGDILAIGLEIQVKSKFQPAFP